MWICRAVSGKSTFCRQSYVRAENDGIVYGGCFQPRGERRGICRTRGEVLGQKILYRSTLKSGIRGKCQKIVKMISDFQ